MAKSVRGAEFGVVSTIINGSEHSEERFALTDADRGALCRKQRGRDRYQDGGYGNAPEKQLGNQAGLPQPDWDEWFSERSLRASTDRVKPTGG